MPWTTTSSPSSGALGADFRVIFRVISAPKIRRGTVKNQGSPDSRKQPQGPENPDKHTLFSYFAGKTESPPECRFWPATGSSPLFSTSKTPLNAGFFLFRVIFRGISTLSAYWHKKDPGTKPGSASILGYTHRQQPEGFPALGGNECLRATPIGFFVVSFLDLEQPSIDMLGIR